MLARRSHRIDLSALGMLRQGAPQGIGRRSHDQPHDRIVRPPPRLRIRQHYRVQQPVPWREIFQGQRGQLTAGVLLVEFLVAVEALVVVSIMPAVRHELGGLQYYGLVFTGFSLAALVATPLGGRGADRRGPAQPFLAFAALFIVGTVLCAISRTMLALVAARVVQGFGAGGAYTAALAAVTRSYDDAGRARVLALLAGAWIVPGLLGPSFGALLATTVGWRWAFIVIVPLILLALALALPGLRVLKPIHSAELMSIRWPMILAIGLSAIVVGLTFPSLVTTPLVVIGGVVGIRALLAILPRGSIVARPGMPAGIFVIFLLVYAFIGTEYFLPLILTEIRGRSIAEAGLIVSLGTVSWSLSNYWQPRAMIRFSIVSLTRVGIAILTLAIAGVFLLLTGAPLVVSYAAWFLAGVGMGFAYPTAYLVIMRGADAGAEGSAVSAQQVSERLALALGGAVGGGFIALALGLHASLSTGLTATFVLTLIAALAALALASRLRPSGPAGAR